MIYHLLMTQSHKATRKRIRHSDRLKLSYYSRIRSFSTTNYLYIEILSSAQMRWNIALQLRQWSKQNVEFLIIQRTTSVSVIIWCVHLVTQPDSAAAASWWHKRDDIKQEWAFFEHSDARERASWRGIERERAREGGGRMGLGELSSGRRRWRNTINRRWPIRCRRIERSWRIDWSASHIKSPSVHVLLLQAMPCSSDWTPIAQSNSVVEAIDEQVSLPMLTHQEHHVTECSSHVMNMLQRRPEISWSELSESNVRCYRLGCLGYYGAVLGCLTLIYIQWWNRCVISVSKFQFRF